MKKAITSFFILFFLFSGLVGFTIFSQPAQAREGEDFSISNLPNDYYYDYQWYLERIEADKAWERIKQSPEVVVAVIDTGIQVDHPDLKDNIWINQDEIPDNGQDDDRNGFIDDYQGWDFISNTSDPSPRFEEGFTETGVSHGTIVAGIVAASTDNKIGVAGVTWKAKIMPLRVLDDGGQGGANNVIRAIDYAIRNKADIINLSFVGPVSSEAMRRAIRRAYEAGVIVVAAAGNEQSAGEGYNLDESPMYPVCYDQGLKEKMVIGVGGTDTLDQKVDFSSYGECVDIMAPGVSIFNTVAYNKDRQNAGQTFDKYYNGFWSGTSMSAPIVSGSLALIEAANPELNSEQVKEILLDNADNIDKLNPDYLGKVGVGRVNVKKGVSAALNLLNSKELNILVTPHSQRGSQVRMIDYNNEIQKEFTVFPDLDKGVNLASGDIDGDGKDEIITGAGPGGGPHVRIFNSQAQLVGQFFAYNPNFRGGVNLASGDIDGDGKDEIITGAGPGGGPHVRVFDNNFDLEAQFFAFRNDFQGGVNLACGNVDGGLTRNKEEIIVSPQTKGGPQVRIFNNFSQVLNQFFVYKESFRGGVNLGTGDINKDGWDEIITGAGPGGGPHVRIFNFQGDIINSFYSYDREFSGGVKAEIVKVR